MKVRLLLLLAMLFATTFVLGHGDYQHVMGTVTKISQDLITVQTTTNEIVEVVVSPNTKFSKADVAVGAQDLKLGDRVVMHAKKTNDGKLVAHTVQIGVAKRAAASH